MSDSTKSPRITPSYKPKQSSKTAPCQTGCPNCGDIRGWIGIVAQQGKTGVSREEAYAQAWRLITEVNPFPATLGRICPHPCENHCNRGDRDEPLAINAMERFLGDFAINAGLPLPRSRSKEAVESIGVIGAGPSGLSFAYQMSRRGYRVTVYDAREKPGGMLRYGVPDYRLPQQVLDSEVKRIVDLGVRLELKTAVGKDVSLDKLKRRHACLFLGIGAQKGMSLDLPGSDGPSITTATDYLAMINQGQSLDLGSRVIVIGGGNSAMDAARCARRGGAHVTVLYRRSLGEMPAIQREIEEAMEEGVELMLLVAPTRFERAEEGRLVAVHAVHMSLGDKDRSGRPRPLPREGTDFRLETDSVITAVSQKPDFEGLDGLAGDDGWLISGEHGAITDNLWVGGDALGLGIAGTAIVQGRHAAEQLHARLRGIEPVSDVSDGAGPEIGPGQVLFDSKPDCGAVHPERMMGKDRVEQPAAEVSQTISEDSFLQEAERCFSCGSCFGCEQCYMYCTAGCFTRIEEAKPGEYFVLNLDACEECGKCVEVCPCGYLDVQ
jgi:NADPH-dependent glutamate synthase beta subunit-like oxidoreductase/ferredoxin